MSELLRLELVECLPLESKHERTLTPAFQIRKCALVLGTRLPFWEIFLCVTVSGLVALPRLPNIEQFQENIEICSIFGKSHANKIISRIICALFYQCDAQKNNSLALFPEV